MMQTMRRDTHLVKKVVGRFGDQIINSYDTIYPQDLMRLKCIYSMFMFTSNANVVSPSVNNQFSNFNLIYCFKFDFQIVVLTVSVVCMADFCAASQWCSAAKSGAAEAEDPHQKQEDSSTAM